MSSALHPADQRLEAAILLMEKFADRTGLTGRRPPQRYLETDAFAVCNFLGLARATDDARFTGQALRLIEQVHWTLGRHRPDDHRSGWISGLGEAGGREHPTQGGLRIGKPLPERPSGEPVTPSKESDRDGQSFHHLTRRMHALDQACRFTGDLRFNLWGRELARAAGTAFVRRRFGGPPIGIH